MNCPVCGAATVGEDAFCGSCGTNLAEARATCPNCGHVNRPDASFCTACGTALAEQQSAGVAPPAVADAAATVAVPPAEPATAPPSAPAGPAPAASPPAAPPPPVPAAPPAPAPAPAPAEAAPPAAPPESARPGLTKPVTVVGAAIAAVGAFLPWLDLFTDTANAFDAPVQFLVDYQTTADDALSVGLFVVVLAGLAGVLAVVPALRDRFPLVRFVGVALVAVAAAFVLQVVLAASDLGISFFDIYGFGPFVTAAGGLAVLSGK